MKTKIYYGRDLIGRFNCDGRNYTRFQMFRMKVVRLVKRVMVVMFSLSVLGWSFYAGSQFIPKTVVAEVKVQVKDMTLPPVMQRIKTCESTNSQLNKSGQVLVHVNKDGSYDIGAFQINSIHNAAATKLGYDLTKEKDNEAYAVWLYENRGTSDWYSSQKCWSK